MKISVLVIVTIINVNMTNINYFLSFFPQLFYAAILFGSKLKGI